MISKSSRNPSTVLSSKANDAAEFIAGGGLVDELRTLMTGSADSSSADARAARAVRAEALKARARRRFKER